MSLQITGLKQNSLWKDAQGDELPEIDCEVVALVGIPSFDNPIEYAGYKVVFAHRPNPKGTDGKFLSTGKVGHIEAKCRRLFLLSLRERMKNDVSGTSMNLTLYQDGTLATEMGEYPKRRSS